jgi:hypothetical protein
MLQIRPITQSQYLVQASPWMSLYFTSFTGLSDTATTTQYADGVRQRIYNLRGPKVIKEMTLSTPFDPTKHDEIVDFWTTGNCDFITVSVTPVTCGENPQRLGSRQLLLLDAQLSSLTFGQVDRTSGNPSTLELTLVSDNFRFS